MQCELRERNCVRGCVCVCVCVGMGAKVASGTLMLLLKTGSNFGDFFQIFSDFVSVFRVPILTIGTNSMQHKDKRFINADKI